MLHPGDVVDERFVIDRFVARGGMGEVYRAADRVTGRSVAIKLVLADDDLAAARFDLEAQALLALRHPAIVRHVAHGVARRAGPYLAMEWLDGVTLHVWLRGQALALGDALRLGARVADALGAAHARGLVHRDVKPGNLMLVGGAPEAARLIDFGLVRHLWRRAGVTGAGMGTPGYMAPEQVRCEPTVGPPADVFALGCVLFRAVTGRGAFDGELPEAVLAKIALLDEPPRAAAHAPVPPVVDALLASMMARDPARRPADGAAAAAAIHEALAALSATHVHVAPPVRQALSSREQRPVAVLFVDLPRPAALPAAPEADPDVRLVLDAVAPAGARVAPLPTGTLVVTLDGGALASDLAARAARCALAVHAALPAAAISLTAQHAVHDGLGPGASRLSAVIDVAAALRRPGRILVDARTRALLPPAFELVDAEIGAALVSERAAAPGGPAAASADRAGTPTPFVGRQAVLRTLEAAVAGALEERAAHAVVVVGEAGVGKSRLRAELLSAIRTAHPDAAIATAAGDALRADAPGGLISRALAAALALPDGPTPARLAALRARLAADEPAADVAHRADFLGELLGLAAAASPSSFDASPALRAARQDPRLMAEQRRRAVEDTLAAACARAPRLLVLDDLHWADAASIELVAAALRRARDLPLVVLAFARPEVHARFPRLEAAWSAQAIKLEPLRPQVSAQLVRALLAAAASAAPAPVDDALVARLVERGGGNPLYLGELVRAAVAADAPELPASVIASLQLRIGACPAPARRVLRAASVLGRAFWPGAVAALLGGELSAADIDGWLDVLVADGLVVRAAGARTFTRAADGAPVTEPEYAFAHDLVRDAAYEMLTSADRQAGHRLAGDWLTDHGEPDPAVLAEHFAGGGAAAQAVGWFERAAAAALAAGDRDVAAVRKAATWYRRAGETCAAVYADEPARTHLERAVALWTPLDPVEAARARLALARVLERAGDRDRALAELAAAAPDADAGDTELRVELLLEQAAAEGRSGRDGALVRARGYADRAAAVAAAAGRASLQARALVQLASTYVKAGSRTSAVRARELAEQALALADDPRVLAPALWRLGNAALLANDLDAADRHYALLLQALGAGAEPLLEAHAHANRGMVAFRRWDLTAAIASTRRALGAYERLGAHTRCHEMRLNLGMLQHFAGDHEAGRARLAAALAGADDDWVLGSLSQETLSDLDRLAGDEPGAQARLRDALARCERAGATAPQATYHGLLAELRWACGDLAGARAALDRARALAGAPTRSHAVLAAYLGPPADAVAGLRGYLEPASETDPQRRAHAQLVLARASAWAGQPALAREALAAARATLAATAVPRFDLPITCLASALDGALDDALDALSGTRTWCAPHERAEAALDVGEALRDRLGAAPPPPGVVEAIDRYLALTTDLAHAGLRPRLDALRAELAAARAGGDRAPGLAADGRDAPGARVADPAPPTLPSDGVTASPSMGGAGGAGRAADDATGAVVAGRYHLHRRIGAGGMAEVFVASAIGAAGFARPVAVKRVLPGLDADPRFARLFADEARLSGRLRHPGIVSVLDVDRDQHGRMYLVMELVEGKDLRALMDTGPLPVAVAVHVVAEVLRALAFAHALTDEAGPCGVVHRDVTPHNILLSWHGEVKLSDFGIARALRRDPAEVSRALRGKPPYMAPEQVLAPEAVDARADVFGAGAVLYELLTTRRVYQGRTTDEVLADVAAVGRGWRPITPVAVLAPDVPPSLAAATLALVAPSRDDRPATALAALALVEDALVLTPPVAPGAALVRAALAARFPTEAPRAVELAADALAPRAPDLAAVMSAETRTIDPAAVTAESLDRDDDR